MSTSRVAWPAKISDVDTLNYTPFWRYGTLSQSAAPEKRVQSDTHYDFVTFLGLAQRLEIDFLPITWQPKLDVIGKGGTAEIWQTLINVQISFAFKRIKQSRQARLDESKIFQDLILEIAVLGNEVIRNHPNIIRLEGICWDIQPGEEKIWPVLVFEKSQYGDLEKFANSDRGKIMRFEDRLRLCVDIGTAIKDIYSCCERLRHSSYNKGLTHSQMSSTEILSLRMY
jgi:Protein tyrosine and serine/threonine kinase